MLDWTRRVMGDGVVFYPPQGPSHGGAMRVRHFVRPLRRLRDIRTDQCARLRRLGSVCVSEAKRVGHCEGEHAVTYRIDVAGMLAVHVGVVFGDDGYLLVEGMCGDPALASTFEELCRKLTSQLPLGLGSDRRRRYLYRAPAGWQALVKRHAVVWYPPDYPKRRAALHVYDANVRVSAVHGDLERLVYEEPQTMLQSIADSTRSSVLTDTGLRGAYEVVRGTSFRGEPSAIVRSTLADNRFSYSLRLEASGSDLEAAKATFDAVLHTVEPVPLPAATASTATLHWID